MEVSGFAWRVASECALLAFLERSSGFLSNFHARKLCHAGTGLMLLQLDSRQQLVRFFVYAVGLSALAMTWEVHPRLRPFRFGRTRDIGMTAYMLVAMLWFFLQLPVYVLAPMFFADPMGAVVGKYLSGLKDNGVQNPIWWSHGGVTKTIGGSAAVLFFTVLTFAPPATLLQRLLVGVAAVLAEAIGGAYDNFLLVLVVVGSRMLLNFLEFGSPSLEHGRAPFAGELAPMTLLFTSPSQAFLSPH